MNKSIAISEVIDDGDYQIINLPEGFQFDTETVWVQKIGDAVFLSPKVSKSLDDKAELQKK